MGEAIVQTVAQVVVDRATQAAWELLNQQMKKWLGCQSAAKRFANTCALLGPLRMQELIVAPDSLVSAFAADLLIVVEQEFAQDDRGAAGGALGGQTTPAPAAASPAAGPPPPGAAAPQTTQPSQVATVPPEEEINQAVRQHLYQTLKSTGELLNVFFKDFIKNWKRSGMKNAMAGADVDFRNIVLARLTDAAADNQCRLAKSPPVAWGAVLETAEWIVGRCLLSGALHGAGDARISTCDIETLLKDCDRPGSPAVADATKERIREYVAVFKAALSTGDAQSALRLPFMVARDMKPTCNPQAPPQALKDCSLLGERIDQSVDAMESLVIGIYNRDYIKITAGVAELLPIAGRDVAQHSDGYVKALRAVTTISQLAYHAKDTETDAKARRDVIESLMKSMVNRSNRVGYVLSLGGSFGVAAAYRAPITDLGTAGLQAPFALPLGFALQQYLSPGQDYGFHLQVSVLDIGQYVAWEGKDFTVKAPNLQDAVSFSIQTGIWFGNRNIPLFVGPHLGVAPFARGGTPSLFVGGMLGAYVPFLDFN
ncbi:hypothetical protein BVG81_007095 [Haliangium sp. UPWRP_2]|nr:hypothetical protein BVG81_007095 [Haliangium sp. UPWRP_2]